MWRVNYYRALRRDSDGRYDYTVTNDGRTYAVGYCFGWRWTDEEVAALGLRASDRGKYHDGGHGTREEAVACYRRFELDNAVMDVRTSDARKCLVCDVWTDRCAQVGHTTLLHLCDEHRTPEEIERRYEGSVESASSW